MAKAARIDEMLAELTGMSTAELRIKWRVVIGSEAPTRVGRDLMVRAVGYALQERARGALAKPVRRELARLAEQISQGQQLSSRASKSAANSSLKPGSRLIREWRGRTHEVVVLEDGFLWQEKRYRSLSEIARRIAGTNWSGPRFFGLKPRMAQSDAPR